MFITNWFKRFGFANIASFISLFVSISSLVIVARISSEQTQRDIISSRPFIVRKEENSFEPDNAASKVNSSSYEEALEDIDHVVEEILERVPKGNDDTVLTRGDNSIEEKIRDQNGLTSKEKSHKDPLFEKGESIVSSKSLDDNSIIEDKQVKIPLPIRGPIRIKGPIANRAVNENKTNPEISTGDSQSKAQSQKKPPASNAKDFRFENINGKFSRVNPQEEYSAKVQLGLFQTRESAIQFWFRLKDRYDWLNNFRYSLKLINVDSKPIYRLYVETASESSAEELCKRFGKEVMCEIVD